MYSRLFETPPSAREQMWCIRAQMVHLPPHPDAKLHFTCFALLRILPIEKKLERVRAEAEHSQRSTNVTQLRGSPAAALLFIPHVL